jgi:20S proteasome subunit alpha 5
VKTNQGVILGVEKKL